MSLTIAILSFNERNTLERVVADLRAAAERAGCAFEVLIVDDGSTDGSAEVANRLAASWPDVRLIAHPTNQGLGGVYRTGFREARGSHLTFFPADGQFPPAILEDFVPRMADYDLVLGYLPSTDQSAVEKVLSRAERFLYRLVLGPVPRFQGIFMIRRELVEQMGLQSSGRGWAVVMELIIKVAREQRHAVISVPTRMVPRTNGRSKVRNLRTITSNFWQIIRLRSYL